MIVSIGVDCEVAIFLRNFKLRDVSMPFDWIVSYNGVAKCIEEKFKSFVPDEGNKFNKYDMQFYHHFLNKDTFEEDKKTFLNRTQKFVDLLETYTDELVFFRKGHACHHHHEHDGKYSTLKNDILDAEELDRILSGTYKTLNYKIIVLLVCGMCFERGKTYPSSSLNIEIHNIATPKADSELFLKTAREIFKV
jgi:hypothetical protein